MTSEMITVIGASISGIGTLVVIMITAIATWKGRVRFDKLDFRFTAFDVDNKFEHDVIHKEIKTNAADNSVPKRIRKVTAEYEQFVLKGDITALKFMKSCQDVSIYFYEQMTVNHPKHNTDEDIERCGNHIISVVQSTAGKFDKEFYDLLWDEFYKTAIDVRIEFLDIFQAKYNGAVYDEFADCIVRYLRTQYKLVIRINNEYGISDKNGKNKGTISD